MSSSTSLPTKLRATRAPKPKMPAAIAHQLDIARAARMGVDISFMAPDERCKYPSKFCCNVRARKSTGKLHRFCEDHRSRANVNQKRWAQVRRRHHETVSHILTDAHAALESDLEWLELPELEPSLCSSTATDLSDDDVHMLMSILLCDAPQDPEWIKGSDACFMASLLEDEIPSGTMWLAERDLALVGSL